MVPHAHRLSHHVEGVTRTALFVGDCGWDTTLFVDRIPEPDEKLFTARLVEAAGGVAANAAVACARAGVPAQAWLGLGDDAAGQAVRAQLSDNQIAVVATCVPGPTCRCVILIEPSGEKRLLLSPGVSMYPAAERVRTASLDGVGWMHTAVYEPHTGAEAVARCRERGIPWSLDLEPATFEAGIETLHASLRGASVVFCNTRAAAKLGPDPAAALASFGVEAVVLTRNSAGAIWQRGAERVVVAPDKAIASAKVVDTTGAGDCLAAWFIAETLRGADPATALRRAVNAATLSCSVAGAQPAFPTREALDTVLEVRRSTVGRVA